MEKKKIMSRCKLVEGFYQFTWEEVDADKRDNLLHAIRNEFGIKISHKNLDEVQKNLAWGILSEKYGIDTSFKDKDVTTSVKRLCQKAKEKCIGIEKRDIYWAQNIFSFDKIPMPVVLQELVFENVQKQNPLTYFFYLLKSKLKHF